MKHLGLFEGIGGFSLAARWMGWETVAWCEWNEFCQKVLRYHFPEAEGHGDITKTDFKKYANTIDILTGGFPCQPYSQAGKRLGKEDDRHLWPQMLRAIREVQPRWVVGENVLGLLNWNGGMVLDEIKADLEAAGFEVFPPLVLPACGKDAPHRRYRLWIVAHARSNGHTGWETFTQGQQYDEWRKTRGKPSSLSGLWATANPTVERPQNCEKERQPISIRSDVFKQQSTWSAWRWFPSEPPIYNGDDGLFEGLDFNTISESEWRTEGIKAGGNAIVPQLAYEIFKTIEHCEL